MKEQERSTCETCKFRGTNYCSHPHTCSHGESRCGESEIALRINAVELGTIKKGRKDPNVQEARQMLKEWKEEMK